MGITNGADADRYTTHLQTTTYQGNVADLSVRTFHVDSHTNRDGERVDACYETEAVLVQAEADGWVNQARIGHMLFATTLMGAARDHERLVRQARRIIEQATGKPKPSTVTI